MAPPLLPCANALPAPPSPFRLGYRPALDGLRGIAVLSVVLFHTGLRPFIQGGFLGVDLFFVLSGFLITTLLLQERRDTGVIGLRDFYLRRLLRLLPALVVMLVVCWLLAHQLWPRTQRHQFYPAALLTLFYVANWAWVFRVNPLVLGHCWSLGVEEQFYLLWPLTLYVLLRLGVRRDRVIGLVILGIVAAGLVRYGVWRYGGPAGLPVATMNTFTRADSLLVGCLVGLLACWNRLPRKETQRRWLRGLACVAAAALGALLFSTPAGAAWMYGVGYTLAAVLMGVILAALVVSPPRVFAQFLNLKPLVWTGRISYGLYLWHIPMLTFTIVLVKEHLHGVPATPGVIGLTSVLLSLAFAVLSFYVVERPFLRLKGRLGGRAEGVGPGRTSVGALSAG